MYVVNIYNISQELSCRQALYQNEQTAESDSVNYRLPTLVEEAEPKAENKSLRMKSALRKYASGLPTGSANNTPQHINFAAGTSFGASPGPSYVLPQLDSYREDNVSRSDSKVNLTQLEDIYAPIRTYINTLTPKEKLLFDKLYPFIAASRASTKTVSEISWFLKVSEEDVLNLVDKLCFLQIVRKSLR
jgi:hypothetical protein